MAGKRGIPVPHRSLYQTEAEYQKAKTVYDQRVREQWASAKRLYTTEELLAIIEKCEPNPDARSIRGNFGSYYDGVEDYKARLIKEIKSVEKS